MSTSPGHSSLFVAAPRVVQITDPRLPDEALATRLRGLPPRSASNFAVQLRDPQLSAAQLVTKARFLRRETSRIGARLIINDRLDIAKLVGADGVHLGRRSVSPVDARQVIGGLFLSRSLHSLEELADLDFARLDAIVLSPIFASPGKGPPLGIETLREVRDILPVHLALLALGGVTRENGQSCLDAGADGLASIAADLGQFR